MGVDSLRVLTVLHFTALAGLFLYGLHRLWIIFCWLRERRNLLPSPPPIQPIGAFPAITVQLPLYNERFVAVRLIDAAAALEWPKDRLEIQVLDDSTDDTGEIVDAAVALHESKGIDIKIVRRPHREGFKAGALKNGLSTARGEFIAIFDADFLPRSDFLARAMHGFATSRVGMVQARWTFLNANTSWLTGMQALLLGPHFCIEHWVRFKRRLFFNFNGTAGIWRRETIDSAGGWQSDTVTEDLDLSYRAQLCGWEFVYLDEVSAPSELPITLAAFRSQQQRWAKGSIQTAKKVLPRLLTARLPIAVKVEACAHLMANFCWLLGAVVTLTLYPAILWRVGIGPYQLLKIDLPLLTGTSCAILLYFCIYSVALRPQRSLRSLILLPVFSIGMSPGIALSILKGMFSSGGNFERTPKFGIHDRQRPPLLAFLYRQRSFPYLVLNAALLAYSFLPAHFAWQRGTWLAIPFLMFFPCGFMTVCAKEIADLMSVGKRASIP